MKNMRGAIDTSLIPVLLVILIPIGFIAYAIWGSSGNSNNVQQTVPTTTNVVPTATISLNNQSSLPQTVAVGAFIPFSFTITNTGTIAGDIPFKVYVKWSTGGQDVIDVNVTSLSPGQSKTISESLKFEVANETAQVFLELTQTGQTSEFALPRGK